VLFRSIEFEAGDVPVIIAPTTKLQSIYLISGTVGPFQPPLKCKVPIWLAVQLKTLNKCNIVPPVWMDLENLTRILKDEDPLYPLPFEYMEIASILLGRARDDIPKGSEVYVAIHEIYQRQKAKFRSKINDLDPEHNKVEGLQYMGINELRDFAVLSYNHLRTIHESNIS